VSAGSGSQAGGLIEQFLREELFDDLLLGVLSRARLLPECRKHGYTCQDAQPSSRPPKENQI
jgi:hypothetical protein